MATQRYISTSFWDDEWVMSLSKIQKLLYLYLLTNTMTNIAGVYKMTTKRISFDTDIPEEEVKEILMGYAQAKKVYQMNGYIIIPSWPQHQSWKTKSKIKQGIDLILKELGKDILDFLYSIHYRYHIVDYEYGPDYLNSNSINNEDRDTDISDVSSVRTRSPRPVFVPPSLLEISQYCQERGNTVNPEVFLDHYQANGWKVGKNGMKDWKASVRTWEKSEYNKKEPKDMSEAELRAYFEAEEREKQSQRMEVAQ